mgnify:CR=1 FL=1
MDLVRPVDVVLDAFDEPGPVHAGLRLDDGDPVGQVPGQDRLRAARRQRRVPGGHPPDRERHDGPRERLRTLTDEVQRQSAALGTFNVSATKGGASINTAQAATGTITAHLLSNQTYGVVLPFKPGNTVLLQGAAGLILPPVTGTAAGSAFHDAIRGIVDGRIRQIWQD